MDNILNDVVFVIMTKFLLEIPLNIALPTYTFLWGWGDPSFFPPVALIAGDRLICHN